MDVLDWLRIAFYGAGIATTITWFLWGMDARRVTSLERENGKLMRKVSELERDLAAARRSAVT